MSPRRIAGKLLAWRRTRSRDLPWRGTRDPYRIWVSEIMLQQTRVAAVLGYYERFLEAFPDLEALARAEEPRLLEVWAGLGYYRRVRLIKAAARKIVEESGGEFPRTYAAIRALPGVGDYTAAAIASIAFELPYAVVDGNVARVISRLDGDAREATRSAVRRAFRVRAQQLLEAAPGSSPGDFNQALMDLGALVCLPRAPKCPACPLRGACRAFAEGTAELLPVKGRAERNEKLELTVALVRRGRSLLMRRRPESESVMPGFWELPQAEGTRLQGDCLAGYGIRLGRELGEFRHAITFRSFEGRVVEGALVGPKPADCRWISARRRAEIPITTIARKALRTAGDDAFRGTETKPFRR